MVPFQRPMMYRCRSVDGQFPRSGSRSRFVFSALCRHATVRGQPHSRSARVETLTRVIMRAHLWDQAQISGGGQNGNHSRRARPASRRLMGRLKPIQTEIHSPPLQVGRWRDHRSGTAPLLTLSSGRIISDLGLSLARRYPPESALSHPEDFSSLRRLRVRS